MSEFGIGPLSKYSSEGWVGGGKVDPWSWRISGEPLEYGQQPEVANSQAPRPLTPAEFVVAEATVVIPAEPTDHQH